MAFNAAKADGPLRRRRGGWLGTVALVLTAVVISLSAAAWITDSNLSTLASAALPESTDRISSFEDRFFPSSIPASAPRNAALQPLDRSALAEVEVKLRAAESLLAAKLMSPNLRAGFVEASFEDARIEPQPKVDEARPTATTTIPLPRSRPAAAALPATGPTPAVVAQADAVARSDDRTLLQKLSDLLPGKIRLASLEPDGGLFHQRGPNLAALGYDGQTAVYDISAHAVYLPSGLVLEAHSGMGNLRDDPEHVSVRMAGATPPATYDLKPREKEFHGVQALRMLPAEGNDVFGRSGLLAHTFMLGPGGDSNGCISIRNYDRFLKAYTDGEINRVVVVPSLSASAVASRRPASQS
jgi:Protein of unknown function (DUF2778)